MASERAILASLDANLQITVRVLLAEPPSLTDSSREEPEPPHLAIAASICILADSLHGLIAGCRAATEHALGDADTEDDF
jgi:hypothetical protein